MKRNHFALIIFFFLLSSCNSSVFSTLPSTSEELTATSFAETGAQTLTPTVTLTPMPVTLQMNNFLRLTQLSSTEIDQTDYVSFKTPFGEYHEPSFDLPDGLIHDAYFIAYNLTESGELLGLNYDMPADCHSESDGNNRKGCWSTHTLLSMVNLSTGEKLWEQLHPMVNSGVTDELLEELNIQDFKFSLMGGGGAQPDFTWSPGESRLAIPVGIVNFILIKDAVSGENLHTLNYFTGPNSAFSTDGKRLAWEDISILRVYDLENEYLTSYSIPVDISDIAWSKDDSQIALGGDNGSLVILNPATREVTYLIGLWGETPRMLKYGDSKIGVERLSFSNDGTKLAFTSVVITKDEQLSGRLVIYDLQTKQELNSFTAGFSEKGNIVWAKDDSYILTVADYKDNVLVMMSADNVTTLPLGFESEADHYFFNHASSILYLSEDQTEVTLIRALLDKVYINRYGVIN